METFLELTAILGLAVVVSGVIMLVIFLACGELQPPLWWQRRKALKNLVRIRWSPDGSKYLENRLEIRLSNLDNDLSTQIIHLGSRLHDIEKKKKQ